MEPARYEIVIICVWNSNLVQIYNYKIRLSTKNTVYFELTAKKILSRTEKQIRNIMIPETSKPYYKLRKGW